jgi:phosphoribosylamine--glycine ligase
MKVAVLGKGGREHALQARLAADLGDASVLVVPGNPGIPGSTGEVARDALAGFLHDRGVGLVVVGPEALLSEGIADLLREAKIPVVGPGREAARLESEKTYAKAFFERHGVPTARAVVLASPNDDARLDLFPAGAVVKLDGLAEGKGVIVCGAPHETREAVAELRARYGKDAKLLVEERLEGPELTVMLLVSDGCAKVLPDSRDHKRLSDGDLGPNTGGMGAFSPVLPKGDPLHAEIADTIVGPIVRGLVADGIAYRGFLYVGLMLTPRGPMVLELNARFGDPEAEVVLPLVAGSFARLCLACAEGTLEREELRTHDAHTLAVVLARQGYPRAPEGAPVAVSASLEARPSSHVCVAHARRDGDALVLPSGRALVVVGRGDTAEGARSAAYTRVAELAAPGLVFRRDIGGVP